MMLKKLFKGICSGKGRAGEIQGQSWRVFLSQDSMRLREMRGVKFIRFQDRLLNQKRATLPPQLNNQEKNSITVAARQKGLKFVL